MQSKYCKTIISKQNKLPSFTEMIHISKIDEENRKKMFYNTSRNVVNYQIYMDDLAVLIGCNINLYEYFLKDKLLWLKLLIGPLTTVHYCLKSDYEYSSKIIKKYPIGDFIETCITAFFLLIAKILSSFGLKKYKPNNF